MKKLMRRLSRVRVNHSTEYSTLQSEMSDPLIERTKKRSNVPQGHFPVYVGIDPTSSQRFIVDVEMLRYPIFLELLNKSAHEFGYGQKGVLRIPIKVVVFERVLEFFKHGQQPPSLDKLI